MEDYKKIDLNKVLKDIISSFGCVPFQIVSEDKSIFVNGNYTWLYKSFKQLFALGLREKDKNSRVELKKNGKYIYLNLIGFRSLIDDFSALENVSLMRFDDPLRGNSDIKYLDIPLIKLILNLHNVKTTVDENTALLSFRFELA